MLILCVGDVELDDVAHIWE